MAASCAVPFQPEDTVPFLPDAGSLVTVVFSASGNEKSKVTGVSEENERVIGRWSIFAFDDANGQFRYESSLSGSPLPLQLAAGHRYTCYAIVNYPAAGVGAFDPSSVRTPEDLKNKTAYLGDNQAQALLMFGSASVTPVADSEEEVTISVRRLVSRIDLRGLRVDFSGKPQLSGKEFKLRSVYATNAYRTTRYGTDYTYGEISATRSAWYNTGGWHRGESPETDIDALVGDIGINTVISATSPYTATHSFYAFPNPCPESEDIRTTESWTRRCTRLVIEASIGEDVFYYAINVPSMSRNRIYAASNVVIHGKGSKDPEDIDMDPDIIMGGIQAVIDDGWDGTGNITLE